MARQGERGFVEQAARGVVLLVALALTFVAGAVAIAAILTLVVD